MSIGGPESHELVANPFHHAKLRRLKKAQEAKAHSHGQDHGQE